jgi:hypothetical protein
MCDRTVARLRKPRVYHLRGTLLTDYEVAIGSYKVTVIAYHYGHYRSTMRGYVTLDFFYE